MIHSKTFLSVSSEDMEATRFYVLLGMVLSLGWRVREEAGNPHTQECPSSLAEVWSLRLDEPISIAVNREIAHCDERNRVGFQTAHARPVRLPNTLTQQWQFVVRVLACQVGYQQNSGYLARLSAT